MYFPSMSNRSIQFMHTTLSSRNWFQRAYQSFPLKPCSLSIEFSFRLNVSFICTWQEKSRRSFCCCGYFAHFSRCCRCCNNVFILFFYFRQNTFPRLGISSAWIFKKRKVFKSVKKPYFPSKNEECFERIRLGTLMILFDFKESDTCIEISSLNSVIFLMCGKEQLTNVRPLYYFQGNFLGRVKSMCCCISFANNALNGGN